MTLLRTLSENGELNPWFEKIVQEGTSGKFDHKTTNSNWLEETRPILEAFFHAKFFLTMLIKYGKELEVAPQLLPSGWAAVLYLFNQR